MFTFQEGDIVTIRESIPGLIDAGGRGIVWALYQTDPPAYEVTFWPNGEAFDMTVTDAEICATGLVGTVFEPPVAECDFVSAP